MIARNTTMTSPLNLATPYLIALEPVITTKIFLNLPGRKSIIDNVSGIGEVDIKLGGVTWEMEREYLGSILGKVPSPVSAIVSAHLEDGLDLLQQGAVNIVSEKFRRLVEGKIQDAEFLPMSVKFTSRGGNAIGGGDISENYYWLNSWHRIDVVDRLESELLLMPNDDRDVFQPGGEPMFSQWKLLRLRRAAPPSSYYGIAGYFGGTRFISTDLHEEMKAANLKLSYSPRMLDRRDPVKRYSEENKYAAALNA